MSYEDRLINRAYQELRDTGLLNLTLINDLLDAGIDPESIHI